MGSQGHTQIELYYSIPSSELIFKNISDNILSTISISVKVTNSSNEVILNNSIIKKLRVNSIEKTKDSRNGLIDQLVIDLLPGDYNLEMKVTDENSNSESNISSSLKVPSFDNTLDVSTIQFASLISSNKNNRSFIKGNKLVVPNPSRKYNYGTSLLYVYYEIYNLLISATDSQSVFNSSLLVSNQFGDSLIYTKPQTIIFPGTSCIQTNNLDIRDLEPGNYWISVLITDLSTSQPIVGKSKFTISDPLLTEESFPMTEEDIEKYRDQIKYFASQNELDLYDRLNSEGKRNFLIKFWRSRDYNLETPENEFMLDSFARINYANKNFKNGLNSDMGRVFIIYGQPDEIENRPMNTNMKPYAIWDYFSTGTGKQRFIFVDKSGNQIYTLVHSTVETEIKNYNWMNEEVQQ
ncbi:MAG: GWxTD domain-containing protein [Bacteroidota bacterium]